MTTVQLAAGLLELEALLMNCRAQVLQRNRDRFIGLLLEARTKLDELSRVLIEDRGAVMTQIFLAMSEEHAPLAAVDPVVENGTEGPRA